MLESDPVLMIREITEMKRFAGFAWIIFLLAALCVPSAVFGQDRNSKTKSQELSDDGLPVLVKHLPDWESRRLETSFVSDQSGLKKALGNRPILDLIDFSGGTEAATASYPAGKSCCHRRRFKSMCASTK